MTLFYNYSLMEKAIYEARKASCRGEIPVGAVIVDSKTNNIIASAGNSMEEMHNPTAHAEMIAIQTACHLLGTSRLVGCDIYVTLEPCVMCAQAISFSRIRRLYFGAFDLKGGGVENGPRVFHCRTCHHRPEIYGGLMEEESAKLLKSFFQEKR